ncbi:MAG: type VI secretion protein IcmF/TssM N-terminal domain-containing protein [Candidatus Electrothrix aestuarii]|uniref:Type VI secretion protein IcmF/TssM N-terminal domain-containing protein n=1 Tax=Candidatus Electrothrix aestuarii TaxID=3062594 RepID=A0AAU8LV05_9BACT|nr:type VI secretion protein IcmF/TssM N-terminal domain-containing protein [Candidatus Electrothrix aestuarii]
MLKNFSWLLLFLLVVLVAGAVGFWGINYLGWPTWLGVAVGAGLVGCFLFILFLKKYLVRRRGKKLVEQIVNQGQILEEDATPDLLQVRELEKSWYANLSLLRNSHLRSRGNPVYVLPWYLALGATGTGKTTAISNFALATSVTGTGQGSQTSATRNCDWWFLDKAVVLDTAGRYALPVEGTGDQEEWKRFLSLLAKHRKREPLNGILLFIGADKIREAADDLLRKKGQLLRNRIDNLMRTLGYKIPVRVIVSKMDFVPGFLGFADSVTSFDHDQVMGYWNRRGNPYWQEVLTEVMHETGERLRELRQEYVLGKRKYHPDLLIFPEKFEQLYSGLSKFLEPIFSENRFQETPYLAGIYFGSGRAPVAVEPSKQKKSFSEGKRTFFFSGLFSRILADGRERLEPVKEFVLWRRMTRSLGLLSWWLFCLFCAGLIGISFLNNQNSLDRAEYIAEEISFSKTKPSDPEDFNASVLELEKLRREIIKLEGLNQSHTLSNIHYGHAVNTEQELKARFCDLFESVLQQPLERRLALIIGKVNTGTSNELFADYASFSVEYVYLLKKYLQKKLTGEVSPEFSPAAARLLRFSDGTISSEVASTFAELNTYYLFWTKDRNRAVSRLKILQSDLLKLLANRTIDVSWLYQASITGTDPVTLSDFWSHILPKRYNLLFLVEGAFTENGRKNIYAFFDMAAEAMKPPADAASFSLPDNVEEDAGLSGDKILSTLWLRFQQLYQTDFFTRWYNFAENFPIARLSLDENNWREAAIRMTKASNPYFTLLRTMAKELKDFAHDQDFLQHHNWLKEKNKIEKDESTLGKVNKVDIPPWAETIISFEVVRNRAEELQKAEGKGASGLAAKLSGGVSTLTNAAASKLSKVGAGLDKKKAEAVVSETDLALAWDAYQEALTGLEAATPFKEKTFQVFGSWFKEAVNPGDEVSLYGKTYQAVGTLHGLAKGKYENAIAWQLIEGPFDFLTEFGLRESAAVLQQQWEEQIVAPAETIDPNKIPSFLFEKESGAVWKFVKGSGEPFLQNTVHGYQSREVFGRSLVFESFLYTFLDQGASVVINKQSDYRIEISNRPMKVNRDSTEEPYASVVTVQCAEDKIILENDNYPRTQNFTWSPDRCGDVNLTIEFPSATLHKSYKGNMAFAHFLSKFVDGALHFTPEDFPEEEGHLRNSNIREIILTYALSGQDPVLRLLELKPEVPQSIALPEKQHGEVVFN